MSAAAAKKLMILDGNSLVNRAFYGVRALTTREGIPTNAIFGFLTTLEKLCAEEKPDALCVAFDLHAPTFRHLQYEGYKATRHGMPDELAQQMPLLKEILSAMRIPLYSLEGWEADDILGTVSVRCAAAGWRCVVVTGDRDSLQLVSPTTTVKLAATKGSTDYTPAVFEQEYGFPPQRLVDLKALMGDSSDNIPGVPGVGQKTAMELLHTYASLDEVYAHLDEIKPAWSKKLAAGTDSARMSYDLATIRTDAPLDFAPEDALVQPWDKPALYQLLLRLELIRLIDRYHLREQAPAPAAAEAGAAPARIAALPSPEQVCAIAFSADGHTVAVAGSEGLWCGSYDDQLPWFMALLRRGPGVVCHDAKALLHRLAGEDAMPAVAFDTALAAYLLDPSYGDYSLSRISAAYLGREVDPGDPAAACEAVYALWKTLEPRLAEQHMTALNQNCDLPLCRTLVEMEREGVLVDRAALESFGAMLTQRVADCEALIYQYAGESFNLNSPKQLGELLFDKLGLPAVKKTKTGYSTNAEVLEQLRPYHEIVPAILDYRMLSKLKSTYAEGLLKVIAPDGRIHTTFQNLVTATGRLSSTDPNLQNIPVRTELGGEIRKMFIPRPGWVFVDADYSQIELRVLAHIAQDAVMCRAFREGEDIHAVTASQVFGVPLDEVTPLMRRHAKAVNFGIVYGISEFSLAGDIGVTRKEARAYIDSYLDKYAGVRSYMQRIVAQAREDGYVSTLYGRRRYLPDLKSSNFNVRSGAERIALNTPIQGTAADIIKLAMNRVRNALRSGGHRGRLVLQVHDELIVECPQDEAQAVAVLLKREMESVAALDAPLKADANIGRSWYDAK